MDTINNIDIKKVDAIMAKDPSHKPHISSGSNLTSFFSKSTKDGLKHRKSLFIILFVLIILAIVLFVFKDILFKKKTVETIGPKSYQEAIDQSFKEGYKTDYVYDDKVISKIIETNKASAVKVKKTPSVDREAFLESINN